MSEKFASGRQYGFRPRVPAAQRSARGAVARLSGPAELLQAVPYLLGFHPRDSLVLLGLDDTRLVVTARVDLADLGEAELLPTLLAALARGGAARVIGVVYDRGPAAPLPWRGLVDEVQAAASRHGCVVDDLLRVADGRWWSYLCDDVACCPPEGRPVPETPSAFVAEATVAGMVALPDRAALAATLDPLPEPRRAALLPRLREVGAAEAAGATGGREILTAAKRLDTADPGAPSDARADHGSDGGSVDGSAEGSAEGWVDGWGGELDDAAVVRFGAALTHCAVRNAVWLAIERGRADGRRLWLELARRLPAPYDAAPLFLYGWTSWRAGNGALAGIAAERAVASDPGYTAADLLAAVLAQGLGPSQVPRLHKPGSWDAA